MIKKLSQSDIEHTTITPKNPEEEQQNITPFNKRSNTLGSYKKQQTVENIDEEVEEFFFGKTFYQKMEKLQHFLCFRKISYVSIFLHTGALHAETSLHF